MLFIKKDGEISNGIKQSGFLNKLYIMDKDLYHRKQISGLCYYNRLH